MKIKNKGILVLLNVGVLVAAIAIAGCSSNEAPSGDENLTPDSVGPVAVIPTPAPGQPELEAKVNVNMRSGPGTNYPVQALLTGGQKAALVGISPDGTYYAISVPVATTGQSWVDAQYAIVRNADNLPVIQPPPVPPTVEFTGPQPGDPAATALVETYIRTGPGDNYPAYGIAKTGQKAALLGKSEDSQWLAVRLNPEVVGKGHGWVLASMVSVENADNLKVIAAPPQPETIAPPPPAEGAPTGTATDFLNIRSGPGTNYPVLVVAPPGSTGQITGKSADGQWWQVVISTNYSPDGKGWVNAGYVVTSNVENVPVVEAPPPPVAPAPPPENTSCVLIVQSPPDYSLINPGEAFDMTWQVQNVGSETWTKANYAVSFLNAINDTRLSGQDTFPLEQKVEPGETYQVTIPMTAPSQPGQYGESWIIGKGGNTACYFYNVIQVSQ